MRTGINPIVYVAVENVALREPRRRAALALGFGLVHGMGFASMLRPLLPPQGGVAPLLLLNVGVELGQLVIVAVTFPLLWFFASREPVRYRRVAILGGSTVIGLLGAWWLVERVLGG